jgi:hypothetical protein
MQQNAQWDEVNCVQLHRRKAMLENIHKKMLGSKNANQLLVKSAIMQSDSYLLKMK